VDNEPLAARVMGVRSIATDQLEPNPHNPRVLFDRQPLDILKASIAKVGILVPLTVYFSKARNKYIILDGQRRWICAKESHLPTVPVNEVAEPSLVQNIVTMFQIHKLREDWELMPTALKLELLMQELKEKNEKKLAALTGLDEAVVVRCKKLLSYSKRYQNMMLDKDPERRWKADFFIELYVVRNDRQVNDFEWFTKDKFTDQMIAKYKAGALRSVTEFRLVKQHINHAVKAHKTSTISKRLKEFAESADLRVDHLEIDAAKITNMAKTLTKTANKLRQELSEIDANEFYGETQFWDSLEKLSIAIRKKLLTAGRRLRG
jgi:ParB/RepB/Spo0J family partition protein